MKKKPSPYTRDLPASPTRDELMAQLSRALQQQVLPDAEMRAKGYSKKATKI